MGVAAPFLFPSSIDFYDITDFLAVMSWDILLWEFLSTEESLFIFIVSLLFEPLWGVYLERKLSLTLGVSNYCSCMSSYELFVWKLS